MESDRLLLLLLCLLRLAGLALGCLHAYPGDGGALTLVYWIHAGLAWPCTRCEYDIRIIFSTIDLWVTLSQTNPPGQGVNRVQEDPSLSLQLCFCL